MPRFDAVGFDLLTALLDTWSLWADVAGERALGMRWHAASQARLRGTSYTPFEDIVRAAATDVGIDRERAETLLHRWGEFSAWPDVPGVLARLPDVKRFIVTNCSRRLGGIAAARAGSFDLVMTADEAGAYKPDPRPYRAALERLALDPARVLFVAGSAHDLGGAQRVGMSVYWANRGDAPQPEEGVALHTSRDMLALPGILEE